MRFYQWIMVASILLAVLPAFGQRGEGGASGGYLQISAFPQTINVTRESRTTIMVQLFGPTVARKPVSITATRGRITPASAMTDERGAAQATLQVGRNDLGEITIKASLRTGETAETVVIVTDGTDGPSAGTTPPPQLTVETPSLPADGQSATVVYLSLVDWEGQGIAGTPVNFTTTAGTIEPVVYTDQRGVAAATLVSPVSPACATVSAKTGAFKTDIAVTFTERPPVIPAVLLIQATPQAIPADGQTTMILQAAVYDINYQLLMDVPIVFVTTLGTLTKPSVLTDESGVATTTLVAPMQAGNATVTAVGMGLFNTVNIEFTQPGKAPATPAVDDGQREAL